MQQFGHLGKSCAFDIGVRRVDWVGQAKQRGSHEEGGRSANLRLAATNLDHSIAVQRSSALVRVPFQASTLINSTTIM
jgi:hypothetical protein